jgi:DnaJ-domain-containing protein 1
MNSWETIAVISGFIVGFFAVREIIWRSERNRPSSTDNSQATGARNRQHDQRQDGGSSSTADTGQWSYDADINTVDDCFAIFGLKSGSSPEDIKLAYRRKMKEYHPDKVANLGEKLKAVADLETKKLNKAFTILKDTGYV